MIFELKPYSGIGPLRFGMLEDDVLSLLGMPISRTKNRRNEIEARYSDIFIRFSSDGHDLVEVGFLASSNLIFNNIDIFNEDNSLESLIALDGDVREYLGFIVFFNLGLTLTGFHDEDYFQRAATCFSYGRWDQLKSAMLPFDTSI